MKKILMLVFYVLLLAACKKDKSSAVDCNRITEINGDKMEYDSEGRLVKFNGGALTVRYENINTTVFLTTLSGDFNKTQLDNDGYVTSFEYYNMDGKIVNANYYVRDVHGYSSNRVYERYQANGSLDEKTFWVYQNTYDAAGNLTKVEETPSDLVHYSKITYEYIYDKSKPYLEFIGSGFSLLNKSPSSKNLLIKTRQNGIDVTAYTYTTDSKGRVIYNKVTPLTAGSGTEAVIKYQCD
jgi:hypothetical protein